MKERTTYYMSLLKMRKHLNFDIFNTDMILYIPIVILVIPNTQKTLKHFLWLSNFIFDWYLEMQSYPKKTYAPTSAAENFNQGDRF